MIKIAIILAGGKGERMMPVTELQPKALVPINGVPILKLQIDQLLNSGISKIYILTGHMSEQINDYVNALKLGTKVCCINSDPNLTPGERLITSFSLVKGDFILLYCDNFIPDEETLNKQLGAPVGVTLLLHKREIGNIYIQDNIAPIYTGEKRKTEYPFVELGYIVVRSFEFRNLLIKFKDINLALMKFTKSSVTNFNILSEEYQSLSDFNTYVDQKLHGKIIILDRDGIINVKMKPREYLTSLKMLIYKENNLEIFSKLGKKGFNFVIATNQPGVATGDVTESFLVNIHQKMINDLRIRGINILTFYVCKHHWNNSCECRKPKPGMLNQTISDFKLNREHVIFIGDEEKDLIAAQEAGIVGIELIDDKISLMESKISYYAEKYNHEL